MAHTYCVRLLYILMPRNVLFVLLEGFFFSLGKVCQDPGQISTCHLTTPRASLGFCCQGDQAKMLDGIPCTCKIFLYLGFNLENTMPEVNQNVYCFQLKCIGHNICEKLKPVVPIDQRPLRILDQENCFLRQYDHAHQNQPRSTLRALEHIYEP